MNIQKLRRMTARIPRNIERKELETPEAKLEAEIKTIKTQIIDAIKAKADLDTVQKMQKQLDALDVKLAERHTAGAPQETVEQLLEKDEGLRRFMHDRPAHGSYSFQLTGKHVADLMERKTTIDSAALGTSTSGVLAIDRTPGIVQEARQALRLRNVLTARPTTLQVVDFVKVNQAPTRASMQTESSAKVENAVTFTTGSARVQTIATWIPASRQALDDMSELMGYLRNAMPYYVDLNEEIQMLTGSGTGNDLNGLITQGTAFNTSLLSLTPGWNKSDMISAAIQQVEIANEVDPTFVVLHPTDYWQILRTKDANRNYIFSNNNIQIDPFWNLQAIRTNKIGSGEFLVGSGDPAAVEIRDRMEMTIEIATQHSDWFTKNLIAIRAEKRMTLACYRPGSFIKGTFNTSP